MKTSNDEWLTPREIRRNLTSHLARLEKGEVEKLVLVQGSQMRFVILRVDDYEDLMEDEE